MLRHIDFSFLFLAMVDEKLDDVSDDAFADDDSAFTDSSKKVSENL